MFISSFQLNQNIIQDIKGSVKDILKAQEGHKVTKKEGGSRSRTAINKTLATIDRADTSFAQGAPSTCDIDMTKVLTTKAAFPPPVDSSCAPALLLSFSPAPTSCS